MNASRLTKYIEENDIVRLYQMTFDKYLDTNLFSSLNDNEINLIINLDKYESIVFLYEKFNNVKIDEEIKKYIYSLSNNEIKRYSLRFSISDEFKTNDRKLDYIKALSESESSTVKFAYGIASNKKYIDSDFGIDYVKLVGKCDDNIMIPLIYFLHSNINIDDSNTFDFVNLLTSVKEEYIATNMISLFKNESIPLLHISVLKCSKGSAQTYYAHNILKNVTLVDKGVSTNIAFIIATCEDEEKAYKLYLSSIDEDVIDKYDIVDIIYKTSEKYNSKNKDKRLIK